MSVWNKVLIGLIIVAALGFFYTAARTLKTHDAWRSKAQRLEADLEREVQRTEQLREGAGETLGILQAEQRLHDVIAGRGRVWYGAAPGQVDPSGAVSITVQDPQPHQINENMVLYLFDGRPHQEGGRYLGEFRVTQVAENQVAVAPVGSLSPAEVERLTASAGPWTLYNVMPGDSHELFAGMSDEELADLMPAESVEAYRKDGKAADPNDPPENVVDGNYVRTLHDYAVLFREFARLRSHYTDLIAAARMDTQYLQQALADSQQDEQFRRNEIASLEAERQRLTNERDAVVARRESLEKQLADVRQSIEALTAENRDLAQRLVERDLQAERPGGNGAARIPGTATARN